MERKPKRFRSREIEKEITLFDVDAQLDEAFGKAGTPSRKAAEDRAHAFFTGQLIEEAGKILCPVGAIQSSPGF